MSTPAEIVSTVSSLMNDTAQSIYHETAVTPYLNMAMRDLQEIFEQNNIPVTNQVSALIAVPVGVVRLTFDSIPPLPSDLIEIQRMWETPTGQDNWIPMVRKDFLPAYLSSEVINQFLIWAPIADGIQLPLTNAANDIKLDYIRSIFVTINPQNMGVNIPIKNIHSYISFRTASLCAKYIGENPTRADALAGDAVMALDRTLGISIKGMQSFGSRRRPFRSGWKNSATW